MAAAGAPRAAARPRLRPGARALLYLIVAGAIYGLLFSVNKIATTNGVPTLAYVFWHTLGAGLLLLGGCALTRDWPRLRWPHLRIYLIGGATGIAFPISVLAYVAPNLPAGLVSMVTVLSPMLTYGLALAVRMERFQPLRVGGVLIGLAGILILMVPGVSLPDFATVAWLLLALVAPFCFAGFNVLAALLSPPGSGSVSFACGIQFGALVVLVPVMLGTGQAYMFPGDVLEGDLAVLWATLLTAAAWYLIFEILRLAGPVFLSQFAYIIVLTGFGWGVLIFDERLSGLIWVAVALLFAGLALLTLGARRQAAVDASRGEAR